MRGDDGWLDVRAGAGVEGRVDARECTAVKHELHRRDGLLTCRNRRIHSKLHALWRITQTFLFTPASGKARDALADVAAGEDGINMVPSCNTRSRTLNTVLCCVSDRKTDVAKSALPMRQQMM